MGTVAGGAGAMTKLLRRLVSVAHLPVVAREPCGSIFGARYDTALAPEAPYTLPLFGDDGV